MIPIVRQPRLLVSTELHVTLMDSTNATHQLSATKNGGVLNSPVALGPQLCSDSNHTIIHVTQINCVSAR